MFWMCAPTSRGTAASVGFAAPRARQRTALALRDSLPTAMPRTLEAKSAARSTTWLLVLLMEALQAWNAGGGCTAAQARAVSAAGVLLPRCRADALRCSQCKTVQDCKLGQP